MVKKKKKEEWRMAVELEITSSTLIFIRVIYSVLCWDITLRSIFRTEGMLPVVGRAANRYASTVRPLCELSWLERLFSCNITPFANKCLTFGKYINIHITNAVFLKFHIFIFYLLYINFRKCALCL